MQFLWSFRSSLSVLCEIMWHSLVSVLYRRREVKKRKMERKQLGSEDGMKKRKREEESTEGMVAFQRRYALVCVVVCMDIRVGEWNLCVSVSVCVSVCVSLCVCAYVCARVFVCRDIARKKLGRWVGGSALNLVVFSYSFIFYNGKAFVWWLLTC